MSRLPEYNTQCRTRTLNVYVDSFRELDCGSTALLCCASGIVLYIPLVDKLLSSLKRLAGKVMDCLPQFVQFGDDRGPSE